MERITIYEVHGKFYKYSNIQHVDKIFEQMQNQLKNIRLFLSLTLQNTATQSISLPALVD